MIRSITIKQFGWGAFAGVCLATAWWSLVFVAAYGFQDDATSFSDDQIEFFESKIRPLLVEQCFSCHSQDAEKLQAGLKLDSRDAAIAGGDSGAAIVAGKPDESLLIQSVKYQGFEMPPDKKLSNGQIALLSKWIELGAPWPKQTAPTVPLNAMPEANAIDWEQVRSSHWAWKPIVEPELPTVANTNWCRNPIDHFVLASLEKAKLSTSPPAEPIILIRRMYLDLVGVPPTIAEVDSFVEHAQTDLPAAVDRLLDQLLASPLYGQRWARHWLDVARYSDGYGGFLDQKENHQAWQYRDWVINAFNKDLPWKDFIRMQIAGDIIGIPEDKVATGFFALGPTYISDGGDTDSIAQAKGETLDDRVDTLTRGMLGVTVSCARCHDHKFDPIPQQDYYSMAGVFNNSGEQERVIADHETESRYDELKKELAAAEQSLKTAIDSAKKDNGGPNAQEQASIDSLKSQLDQIQNNPLLKLPKAHILVETGNEDMKIALRGNLRNTGEVAPRRFLRLVSGPSPKKFAEGSGRRELAEALVSPDNPLTARVFVNRIWMHHFGQAIVRTPSNFGTLGQPPTHPELLDWLASQLLGMQHDDDDPNSRSAGSIKSLHRLILSSATYQMSSHFDQRAFDADGDNRLLWRMSPIRMDVEAWRDSLLAVTSELDYSFGRPSIDDLIKSTRRTVYAKVSRNGDQFASDEFLRTFDFPLMRATVEIRQKSIVPQQFLFLLNSPFIVERAQAFARRLQSLSETDSQRIQLAYQMLYSRVPTAWELQRGLAFVSESANTPEQRDNRVSLSPWVSYAQVLLSANEFMYVR